MVKIWVTPILNTDFWHHTYVDLTKPSKSFRLKFYVDSDGGLMAVKNFHLGYVSVDGNRHGRWYYNEENLLSSLVRQKVVDQQHKMVMFYMAIFFSIPCIKRSLTKNVFNFGIWINDGPVEYLKLSLHQLSNDIKTANI
ncbi:hypothetical protein DERP_013102 [Dermatophagoides pteronyssinus]|uniref:Uncharacterized protein n=1 Tax=Dermatophagoides pteronyssinus TaxID=6956 RepID=A0ABQ8J5R5_DERPT|nr:hypothetical protein DERP_013102 [Dermatophagoides pteronyssinus]